MDTISTFREIIAPELNHLYTTPPFQLKNGVMDAGWFCREHALHAYVIALLLGIRSSVIIGHFGIKGAGGRSMKTGESGGFHAWNMIDNVSPVDLSMTFRFHEGFEDLDLPIWGGGRNGPYVIQYARGPGDSLDSNVTPTIILLESADHSPPPMDLLRSPYQLIEPPNPSDPMNWDARYGPEIYARITLHCFRCATGDADATRHRLSPSESPDWLNSEYPDAMNELSSHLQ